MTGDTYEDILYLPHPEPVKHKRMSREMRAAQFAPFAALTGFDQAIGLSGKEWEESILSAVDKEVFDE